jgi:hypothetical protein
MSELLGSIGSFFSGPTGKGLETLAGLGSAGAGLYGNISADQQRQQALNQAKANANLSPAQLAQMVSGATAPLNANLVSAITQRVNANQAEMGLSQAPGLTAQAVAQGLAPYEQENQQTALNLVLQKLGLPSTFASLIPPNTNMNQLLALLMRQNNPAPAPGFTPTTGPNFTQAGLNPDYGTTSPFDTTGTYDFGGLTPPAGSA